MSQFGYKVVKRRSNQLPFAIVYRHSYNAWEIVAAFSDISAAVQSLNLVYNGPNFPKMLVEEFVDTSG